MKLYAVAYHAYEPSTNQATVQVTFYVVRNNDERAVSEAAMKNLLELYPRPQFINQSICLREIPHRFIEQAFYDPPPDEEIITVSDIWRD